ncbi:MAG: hypothetical protein K5765_06020 [Clostridia bacterium]|nr:hypothetical protein [Clostridia bacterium]
MNSWEFGITVSFGKGEGGDSSIEYDVSDDMGIILSIAKELDYDFDNVNDLVKILATKNRKIYEENDIYLEDLEEETGVTFKMLKKIDFDKIDFYELEENVYNAAYKQERDQYFGLYDDYADCVDYDEDEEFEPEEKVEPVKEVKNVTETEENDEENWDDDYEEEDDYPGSIDVHI